MVIMRRASTASRAAAAGGRGQQHSQHGYMQRRGLVALRQHAGRRPRGALSASSASSSVRLPPPVPSGHSFGYGYGYGHGGNSSGGSAAAAAAAVGRLARRALSSGPQRAQQPEEEEATGAEAEERPGVGRPKHKSKITAAQIVRQRQRKVLQLHCDASLEEAVRMLASNNSSCCMVYDDQRKGNEGQKEAVGIFSARDIIKKLSKHGATPAEALATPVKEVMTPLARMIHCSPDETLEKVQYIMVELKIRALPVVKDGVIYGIITLGDVINHQYR